MKLSCSASVAYPDPHHFGKTDPDLQQRENFYPDQRLNGKFNPRGASTATSAPLEALAVFRIRMRIQQIYMFLGFPDPDPPVGGRDLDPELSIIKQNKM